MHDGAVLTGVEMAPHALGLMVVEPTLVLASGAAPAPALAVPQVDVDLALGQSKLDVFHSPRRGNSQNLGIELAVLHRTVMVRRPALPRAPGSVILSPTWAEDRALLRSNPSADPGAGMGRGSAPRTLALPCCPKIKGAHPGPKAINLGRWSSGASLSGGLVALDGDLACTCTHLRGVVPGLHPQQHVHAHVKGLFDAQRHLRR